MKDTTPILEKAVNGERLSREDALVLFENGELLELGLAADAVCRKLHPEPFRTYVVDRNINYTNICTSGCRFCAFYRQPNSPEGYVLTKDQLYEKIQEAVNLGATQILIQGGLHPSLGIEYFEELFLETKKRFRVTLHSLSPPEIVHISRISNISIEETITRLRKAGLDSVPGGGAEILSTSVRQLISPRKCSVEEWLQVMEIAHSLGMRSTATMMFGHIETYEDRVEHLLHLRTLQDKTGGFTAFIPWTFQPLNTELGGETVGGYEYLRTLAISRLVLDNFQNIQASWVTQGSKIGQIALHFGANDLGGTMIEENVVAAAGVAFRMSEQELRTTIKQAGFEPKKRDTYYNLLE
jgi:cyclic dehypoxanthinyl futalosine synthase